MEVASAEQAKELIAANPVIVFGFFPDKESAKAKTFLGIASAVDDQIFAIVQDEKVVNEMAAENEDVVLFKNVSIAYFYVLYVKTLFILLTAIRYAFKHIFLYIFQLVLHKFSLRISVIKQLSHPTAATPII